MKLRTTAALTCAMFMFQSSLAAQAPARSDRTTHDCHVYAVDVGEAMKIVAELMERPDAKPGEVKTAGEKAQKILGRFRSEVGEEVATTRSYPFPGTDLSITATVFYTDEMMARAESMVEALVISKHPVPNALVPWRFDFRGELQLRHIQIAREACHEHRGPPVGGRPGVPVCNR